VCTVQACIDVGFFYLINHGLDLDLLDEAFEQSKRFFALPIEEKMKVIHDENHRGYTPFEEEALDPAKQSKGTISFFSSHLHVHSHGYAKL
jgi:isopenicillin N synthase-like dioxygenase